MIFDKPALSRMASPNTSLDFRVHLTHLQTHQRLCCAAERDKAEAAPTYCPVRPGRTRTTRDRSVEQATLESQFVEAVQRHIARRFAEADAGYRKVLGRDPRHAASWHGLGVIAYQNGRCEDAVELIGRATTIAPEVAAFRANLGNALKGLGRLDEAAAAYRAALAIDPA